MRAVLASIEAEYRRYKGLGERALAQLDRAALVARPAGDGNSVAVIVWHLAGNLKSRFTDFLTSDGEKPWRDRESEFAAREVDPGEVAARWEEGWRVLFAATSALSDDDLTRTVRIRAQELSVTEALHRSLAHASYHVGQMVFLARSLRGGSWQFLTIAPGKSDEYNHSAATAGLVGSNPTREKGPSA